MECLCQGSFPGVGSLEDGQLADLSLCQVGHHEAVPGMIDCMLVQGRG